MHSHAGWNIEPLKSAAAAAVMVIVVGFLIQGLLPIIEKAFRVATSMTLLDYSDASQPLLKRLALEAPGTYTIAFNRLACRICRRGYRSKRPFVPCWCVLS